jgi:hypothetical protein
MSLPDEDLIEEVELVANLMVAATSSDEHLTQKRVDEVLGVIPQPRTGD